MEKSVAVGRKVFRLTIGTAGKIGVFQLIPVMLAVLEIMMQQVLNQKQNPRTLMIRDETVAQLQLILDSHDVWMTLAIGFAQAFLGFPTDSPLFRQRYSDRLHQSHPTLRISRWDGAEVGWRICSPGASFGAEVHRNCEVFPSLPRLEIQPELVMQDGADKSS